MGAGQQRRADGEAGAMGTDQQTRPMRRWRHGVVWTGILPAVYALGVALIPAGFKTGTVGSSLAAGIVPAALLLCLALFVLSRPRR